MVKKVSLRDLVMTVNDFEGTVRRQLGDSPRASDVLSKINTIRQQLDEIGQKNGSDDELSVSDQIFCGAADEKG